MVRWRSWLLNFPNTPKFHQKRWPKTYHLGWYHVKLLQARQKCLLLTQPYRQRSESWPNRASGYLSSILSKVPITILFSFCYIKFCLHFSVFYRANLVFRAFDPRTKDELSMWTCQVYDFYWDVFSSMNWCPYWAWNSVLSLNQRAIARAFSTLHFI